MNDTKTTKNGTKLYAVIYKGRRVWVSVPASAAR